MRSDGFLEGDIQKGPLSTLHVYCGTYRCIEDGRIVHGPLVRYEGGIGKEQEMNCTVCGAMLLGDNCRCCGKPRPKEQGDVRLAKQMLDAYDRHFDKLRGEFFTEEQRIEGMTKALRVAADALLRPVTIDEWRAVSKCTTLAGSPAYWDMDSVHAFLAARRARLEAPAKTEEDKIIDILKRTHGDFEYKAIAAEIIATLKQESR